jgi:uncharacterized membrane protein
LNLYDDTAFVLRAGALLGLVITAAGLIMQMLAMAYSDTVLAAGIVVLIASPFAGVIMSLTDLVRMKDMKWACVAALLTAIVSAGLVLAFFL